MGYLYILIIISIVFFACGSLMLFSAVSGKGINPPEHNAAFHIRAQYTLRGFIGAVFIVVSILIFAGILKTY